MEHKMTSHTETYLKRLAKKIKKEQNITHLQALDAAARQSGFANFRNFQNSLKKKGATGKQNPVAAKKPPGAKAAKSINPYRNLLVAAVNDLLGSSHISLESPGEEGRADDRGHIFTEILGFPSVVIWRNVGFEELEISVWWKYDHSRHPQAKLTGRSRENFNSTTPLARKELYKNFVAVTVTGWLERKDGKYLMGKDREKLVGLYARKGEKSELEKMPQQIPMEFKAEGKFHI